MPTLPSTRFPFTSVTKAMERAEKIYQSDRGGKGLNPPQAFAAWGYSPKSSGGFQTVGALKGYGILDDKGGKEDKVLTLSSAARRYFQTEIDEDRAGLLNQFARSPKLFAHLLDHWDDGSPPDPVARTYLKTVIGLNDQSAKAALSIYKDNLSVVISKGEPKVIPPSPSAREGDSGNEGGVERPSIPLEPPIDVKVGDMVQATIGERAQFVVPKVVTDVFRDPERGWFVSVRGEKGSLPMEQVTVERAAQAERPVTTQTADDVKQPIEVFMTARGRLQISADVDSEGLTRLIDMLEKYKPILALF